MPGLIYLTSQPEALAFQEPSKVTTINPTTKASLINGKAKSSQVPNQNELQPPKLANLLTC